MAIRNNSLHAVDLDVPFFGSVMLFLGGVDSVSRKYACLLIVIAKKRSHICTNSVYWKVLFCCSKQ